MAKADYILSLIKANYNNESERFTTIALQIAAHEAKLGHTIVANDIKTIIDKAKETKHKTKAFAPDLQGLILENVSVVNFADITASEDIKSKIKRIISEFVNGTSSASTIWKTAGKFYFQGLREREKR